MQCLNPISIINPSKYLSFQYADRYVTNVRCGKCAACQTTLSNEWYYRTMIEFRQCIEAGGYVYFDCLTYAPEYLRHISDFYNIPSSLDYPCFSYEDFRLFMVKLRRYLGYRGYDVDEKIRYFACTEYGALHHRPHIHILLFITEKKLSNYVLSEAVSKCWSFGRTDGLPYKTCSYVDNNSIRGSLLQSVRVAKYVSKYVVKCSSFQKELDKRIDAISRYLYSINSIDSCGRRYNDYDDWRKSEYGKRFVRGVIRHVNQFHRQSLHYGESIVSQLDINEVMKTNMLTLLDNKNCVMRLSLPMYYKRKIFYDLIDIDGVKYWQLNELGVQYANIQRTNTFNRLVDEFRTAEYNYGVKIDDPEKLADYVLNHRGRIIAPEMRDSLITERINSDSLIFNYVTSSDKNQFNKRFLSRLNHGNKFKYLYNVDYESITPQEFINSYLFFNSDYEFLLSKLVEKKVPYYVNQQNLFDKRQQLNDLYKNLTT